MKTVISLDIIPIKKEGFHCFINITVNKEFLARMVIDTGASQTVFDCRFIEKLGLSDELELWEDKASGLGTNSMEGYRLIINQLKLGEIICDKIRIGVLDLTNINTGYDLIGLEPLDGAIGGDILNKYQAIIDYGEKTLTLKTPILKSRNSNTGTK